MSLWQFLKDLFGVSKPEPGKVHPLDGPTKKAEVPALNEVGWPFPTARPEEPSAPAKKKRAPAKPKTVAAKVTKAVKTVKAKPAVKATKTAAKPKAAPKPRTKAEK